MNNKRQFSSGSRQAPDPCDQYLEDRNFYRKHTARDSSSLFRVISEQMYDTQMHHLAIRKKCVRYMRKHFELFDTLVDRDLDEYLDEMLKPKTFGTLVELRALCMMYERNVILFEPFTLGRYLNFCVHYKETFRVFYAQERHFDSVYSADYISDVAMCQSIFYEILYKDLFKIPDVSYAVEYMLHLSSLEGVEHSVEYNEEGYSTGIQLRDGRHFDFDLPQDTNCILENEELCHFHSGCFVKLSYDLDFLMRENDDNSKMALERINKSLLPQKFTSCVRQLLDEGITPFPYKVAKALDPTMYRNIEFDSWKETRKEQRLLNWYNGDSNFKVGAKCFVNLSNEDGGDLHVCHIQEIAIDKSSCIVFVEQLGEKRMVPYDALSPLPSEQFKPWLMSNSMQRQLHSFGPMRYMRHRYNYRFHYNSQVSSEYCTALANPCSQSCYQPLPKDKIVDVCYGGDVQYQLPCDVADAMFAAQQQANYFYRLKQYTQLDNFAMHSVEYCTMPVSIDPRNDLNEEEQCDNNNNDMCMPNTNMSVAEVQTSPPRVPSPKLTSHVDSGGMSAQQDVGAEEGCVPEPVNLEENGYINEMGMTTDYGNGGGQYPAEFCSYQQPPYQYGTEGSYDMGSNMYPQPQPPQSFVPSTSGTGGTVYYMCGGNGMPQCPVPYTHAAVSPNGGVFVPPSQSFSSLYPLGGNAPMNTVHGVCHPPPPALQHSSNTEPPSASVSGGVQATVASSSSSRGRRSYGQDTVPLGRVNWEAKRSVRANGSDLPYDRITLRHFYNLGVECQRRHQQQHHQYRGFMADSDASTDAKEDNELTVTGIIERNYDKSTSSLYLQSKFDSNTNGLTFGMSNLNINALSAHAPLDAPISSVISNGGGGQNRVYQPNRRYNGRSFINNSGRDRNQQRGGGSTYNASNRLNYNVRNSNTFGDGGGVFASGDSMRNHNQPSNVTPISLRSPHYGHTSESKSYRSAGQNSASSSGMSSLSVQQPLVEASSPSKLYDNGGANVGGDLGQTPTGGNQSNGSAAAMSFGPTVSVGEFVGDPNGGQNSRGQPPQPAPFIAGSGMYVLPVQSNQGYGVYAQAPPQSPSMSGGLHPHIQGQTSPMQSPFTHPPSQVAHHVPPPPPLQHSPGAICGIASGGDGFYVVPRSTLEPPMVIEGEFVANQQSSHQQQHQHQYNYPPPGSFFYPAVMTSTNQQQQLHHPQTISVARPAPLGSLGPQSASQGYWCVQPPIQQQAVVQQQPQQLVQTPQQQQQQQLSPGAAAPLQVVGGVNVVGQSGNSIPNNSNNNNNNCSTR